MSVCAPALLPDTQTPLLDVRNLCVSFGRGSSLARVVDNVSFSVAASETLCLVGESGSGKSMTALSLLRLTPPESTMQVEHLSLGGLDIPSLSSRALQALRGQQCAMIFQEPMTSLNPVLRIGDQVAEPLLAHQHCSQKEAYARAVTALQQVGIPAAKQRMHEYPHQLSGGMRQRVMIAMALICGPRLLLADEPTTALDVTIQGQILDLLREQSARRGMGLVLITHDLNVVAETADYVGVMYAGRLVEMAPVKALFSTPLHPYTQGLMGAAPNRSTRGKRLVTIPGVVPSPYALPEGCAFAPRCSRVLPQCCHENPNERMPETGHTVRCLLYQ